MKHYFAMSAVALMSCSLGLSATALAAGKAHSSSLTTGSVVRSASYLGVKTTFDGSELLVNTPSVNQDLRVLVYRHKGQVALTKHHATEHPFILLSGKIQGEADWLDPYSGKDSSDLDLTGVELDSMIGVNHWATGYLSLAYNNGTSTDGGASRVKNSSVSLDKGFMVFGDLSQTPFYATLGQLKVPFGSFDSLAVSGPLADTLGGLKTRAVIFGYAKPSWHAQAFVFRGDTSDATGNRRVNNFGLNTDYTIKQSGVSAKVGASYLNNFAEAGGFQTTGGSQFAGFSAATADEQMTRKVGAVDARASASWKMFSARGEYLTATRRFDSADLAFNGNGAKPSTWHAEADYNFKWGEHPGNVALGYDRSKEAMALNVPESRWVVSTSTAFFRDTLASLEFNRSRNYSSAKTASGNGTNVTVSGSRTQNQVRAKFAMYF